MNGVNVDKCLQIYCKHAHTLTDEQVERAIDLTEREGDTRIEIMCKHVKCCNRARNILNSIHQHSTLLDSDGIFRKIIPWVWDVEQCFP